MSSEVEGGDVEPERPSALLAHPFRVYLADAAEAEAPASRPLQSTAGASAAGWAANPRRTLVLAALGGWLVGLVTGCLGLALTAAWSEHRSPEPGRESRPAVQAPVEAPALIAASDDVGSRTPSLGLASSAGPDPGVTATSAPSPVPTEPARPRPAGDHGADHAHRGRPPVSIPGDPGAAAQQARVPARLPQTGPADGGSAPLGLGLGGGLLGAGVWIRRRGR